VGQEIEKQISGDSLVAVSEKLTVRDLSQTPGEGPVFVVTPEGRLAILDNESAVWLWFALVERGESGIRLSELAEGLTGHFQVVTDTALEDVIAFVDVLLGDGVVQRR